MWIILSFLSVSVTDTFVCLRRFVMFKKLANKRKKQQPGCVVRSAHFFFRKGEAVRFMMASGRKQAIKLSFLAGCEVCVCAYLDSHCWMRSKAAHFSEFMWLDLCAGEKTTPKMS